MSTVIDNEAANKCSSNLALNIIPSNETHGIGDSLKEKPLSPCNSLETQSDISVVSSFASCKSFKTICQAWKMRAKSVSTMSLDRGTEDFAAQLEDLTSRLDMTKDMTSVDESRELAQRLSLCVVLESRTLHLTDSSEEDPPHVVGKLSQRFFEPEEIREAFAAFKLCDGNGDNLIELSELKLALEKLAVPQTHLEAKKFMAEIVGRRATRMNFCQFLLTYAAILQSNDEKSFQLLNSQMELDAATESVDVSEVGVSGAKRFFEAKIAQQVPEHNSSLSNEEESYISLIPDK